MSRLSKKKRDWVDTWLLKKYGKRFCKYCSKEENYKRMGIGLVVDHIHPGKDTSVGELAHLFYQWLCRRHNYLKNPRRPEAGAKVNTGISLDTPKASTAEMQKNLDAEPKLRLFLQRELGDNDRVEINAITASGAWVSGFTISTVIKHLKVFCSPAGPLETKTEGEEKYLQVKSGRSADELLKH